MPRRTVQLSSLQHTKCWNMRLNVLFYEDQSPGSPQRHSELSHSLEGNSDSEPPEDQYFMTSRSRSTKTKGQRGTRIDRKKMISKI